MKNRRLSNLSILACCLIVALSHHTFAQENTEKSTTFSEQQKKEKALEFAKRGQEFLKKKQWKEAIAEFEQAVKLQPQSSVLFNLLGVSYLENSQAGIGWLAIRRAVMLDVTNKRAASDFMKIWTFFDRKGLLNVGTPEAEFLRAAGKPDRKRDQNGESQLGYGFMWVNFREGKLFALVDTRGLTADLIQAVNIMEFQLPPDWREGYRFKSASSVLTEYVTGTETVQNYQRLFSTQRLLKRGEQISVKEMLARTKALLEKAHQIEQWNVIEEDENDVLYEWRVAKNETTPAQHEITRLIKGKRDIHRLAYISKKVPLSEETRTRWINLIQSAKLVVAHPENMKLTTNQLDALKRQLIKKSREIIALQLQHIQDGDVKSMQPYFTKRVRDLITVASLEKAKSQAASAKVEDLVHSIQIEGAGDQIQAKIKMKNGRTLTTLVPVNGKWEADTIWFN